MGFWRKLGEIVSDSIGRTFIKHSRGRNQYARVQEYDRVNSHNRGVRDVVRTGMLMEKKKWKSGFHVIANG